MPEFDPTKYLPIGFRHATLLPGEQCLHSFIGQSCVWQEKQKYVMFGDVTGYFPRVPTVCQDYRGHLTNQRFILELPDAPHPLALAAIKLAAELCGGNSGKLIGEIANSATQTASDVAGMMAQRKFAAVSIADIERFSVYEDNIFWVVVKGDARGMGIPFIPRYIDQNGEAFGASVFSGVGDEDVKKFASIISSKFKLHPTGDISL